jgi:hypothetical protein
MRLEAVGGVVDNSPTAESTVIIRFYVYSELSSGDPVVFEAFSADDASGSLLTVNFDGDNFLFNAGGGSDSGPVPGADGWNMIELAWTGGGEMDYWVNTESSETRTGFVPAGAGAMESVLLGPSGSMSGAITFDDYVSHRSTKIGGRLIGDSNNDTEIDVFDMIGTQQEILEQGGQDAYLNEGQPDCNLSGGSIDVFDMICIQNIILSQ